MKDPTQTTADDWKDRLQYEVMENYLFEAQLTDKVIDKAEHMEEMRKHWQKLLSFIEEEKAQAKREVLKNLLELKWITESQVDNYSLYHGLSTEEEK